MAKPTKTAELGEDQTDVLEMEVQQTSRPSPYPDIELNRLVSHPLKVKELKEGEVAIYKLIVADYVDMSRKDTNDRPLLCKPGRKLHHTQRIYDPIKKSRINIRNISSYTMETMPGGGEKEVPKLERFLFPKGGVATVTHENLDTYAWMERHNGNRDNPYRDKTKAPLFYRVNPIKQAIKELENDYILADAIVYVRDADHAKLKAMYEGLSQAAKKDINPNSFETLKRGIFDYAKKNPILAMKASDNKDVRLKIQIMEAEHFNVIAFDEGDDAVSGERKWYFMDSKMTEICKVELAEHKIDGLIKYFKSKEGYQQYVFMAKQLDKVLNGK